LQLTSDPRLNIPIVIKAAKAIYPDYPIVGQLAACQAILESNLRGKPSKLALIYNNLFGITERKGTKGRINLPSHEEVNGKWVPTPRWFSWNLSLEDSFKQHRDLMVNGLRRNPKHYHKVLAAKTFEEGARELVTAGYATDSRYALKLIDLYKTYKQELVK
jgi:flagellum-specific peptidoglycan hydrolase FlgJ